MLLVCPAGAAMDLCRRERPSHVMSLVSPGDPVPDLATPERLVLVFNDIVAPRAGLVPPVRRDIDRLIAFARGWDGTRPLLVHCGAGISRSAAAAFAIACDRWDDVPEREVAAALRAASPHATPNALMVALADAALGRAGRMIEAARAIGRGADWIPDPSFRLTMRCRLPA